MSSNVKFFKKRSGILKGDRDPNTFSYIPPSKDTFEKYYSNNPTFEDFKYSFDHFMKEDHFNHLIVVHEKSNINSDIICVIKFSSLRDQSPSGINHTIYIEFHDREENYFSIYISKDSLYNCQVSTLGGIEDIINLINEVPNTDMTEVFLQIFHILGINMLVCDIDRMMEDDILSNKLLLTANHMQYDSTNSSERSIFLLNIRNGPKQAKLAEKIIYL